MRSIFNSQFQPILCIRLYFIRFFIIVVLYNDAKHSNVMFISVFIVSTSKFNL